MLTTTESLRPTVAAVVVWFPGSSIEIDGNERLLVINQNYPDEPADRWRLPQGGIKRGETPHQAALREVLEETGLVITQHVLILSAFSGTHPYSSTSGHKKYFTHGVAVHSAENTSAEPKLNPNPHEHVRAAQWVSLCEATELFTQLPRGASERMLAMTQEITTAMSGLAHSHRLGSASSTPMSLL